MSIQNYGKKLIREGALNFTPPIEIDYSFEKIWPIDFGESVVFYSCRLEQFQSVLHFFWQTVFHQRDVKSLDEAEEIFTATQFIDIEISHAKQKIKEIYPDWFEENQNLIPNPKWTHVIWEDDNDVYMVFEDEEKYYAWSWDVNSAFV